MTKRLSWQLSSEEIKKFVSLSLRNSDRPEQTGIDVLGLVLMKDNGSSHADL